MRRTILATLLAATAGCATPMAPVRTTTTMPSVSNTLPPHALARRDEQERKHRVAMESGTRIEGALLR